MELHSMATSTNPKPTLFSWNESVNYHNRDKVT